MYAQRHDVSAVSDAERADADQQPERPRRLDDAHDPAAAVVRNVVGRPGDQPDVEHDLGQRQDEQPTVNMTMPALAPATSAPAAMPTSPASHRRAPGMRSTS